MITCSHCGIEKDRSEFYPSRLKSKLCKKCCQAYQNAYRSKDEVAEMRRQMRTTEKQRKITGKKCSDGETHEQKMVRYTQVCSNLVVVQNGAQP